MTRTQRAFVGCCIASAFGLALSLGASRSSAPDRRPDDGAAGYIVVLDADLPSDSVSSTSRAVVEAARGAIPSLRLKDEIVYRHALRGFAVRLDARDAAGLEQLKSQPAVAFVVEDRRLRIDTQVFQPGLERIRARDNATTGINGAYDLNVDVDIAILDTGIDPAHPDLNVFHSVSFVTGDPTLIDPHGHGTHIAGIAAAVDDSVGIFGVAPGARLWSVKVIDQYGLGDLSDILAGLDYVAAHADEIDVVNMSFGSPGLGDDGMCGASSGDPLHQAVCALVDAGVVVVVSAGNYPPFGRDASLVSPACFDEVITVSAVVETDGLGPGSGQGAGTIYGADNSFASTFSNYGHDVDLAAPGVDVISTWPGGGYSTQSGTSVAAPQVAGAAALWIAKYGKPAGREDVMHVRDELVRAGFPQRGVDEGFSGDRDTFAEPVLNVAAIDPAVFDPVEPRVSADRPVYDYGQDTSAVITIEVADAQGAPFAGIPSNGFRAYLEGELQDVPLEEQGQGIYSLVVDIGGLLPGDHDFHVEVTSVSGFTKTAGCRIVVHAPTPRLLIHDMAFAFPVMNYESWFGTNPLQLKVMDGKGAPVVLPPQGFQTTFSGGGPALIWWLPAPDPISGVSAGITYGAHRTEVAGIHELPLGTYYADVVAEQDGLTDQATASFDMAYYDPLLLADLRASFSTFDHTQPIAPPALDLTVEVGSEFGTGVTGLLYLLEQPFTLKIDGATVPGAVFIEDLLDPGSYTVADVSTDVLSHGSHEIVVHVADNRGLETDSNAVTIHVLHDASDCADPLAAGGQPDADGDGVRDACDNCPAVSNRSQESTYSSDDPENGLGDACRNLPRIVVSSDPSDNPDFFSIQEAVDGADSASDEVRVEIRAGTGPYLQPVVVDRDTSFRFVGVDTGAGLPVISRGGGGGAVIEIRSAGTGPAVLRNLVLRGQGIGAGQRGLLVWPGISTRVRNVRFEQLGRGLDLRSGTHVVEHVAMDETVGTGVLVDGGVLDLSYGEFRGLAQALGILGASAAAHVEHVLVAGDGEGEGIASAAPLDLRYSTLVHCGTAVSGDGDTTIAHSVLWNNQTDVAGVSCSDIVWSDLQDVDCGGTNQSTDPAFVDPAAGNYRLQPVSPLLDHGPDPAQYGGVPCFDLDGGPRLRDHDGDGLAQQDPGAYERANAAITPAEVTELVWSGPTTLEWSGQPGNVEYHIYRAPLATLGYSAFGVCADGLETSRSDTVLIDAEAPPPGGAFYYEITVEDVFGEESSLGAGTCAERSNFSACQ